MRGDGRIFLRGQIYWCAYYLNGKEYRESTGQADETKASKFLQHRLREVGADLVGGKKFVAPQDRKLLIRDLLDALRQDYELRGITSSQNKSSIARADRDFGDYRAFDLQPERVDAYIRERQGHGDRPATINRTLQHVVTAYRLAIDRGHLTSMPKIRVLSERGNARKGFFSQQEIRAVIANLPADVRDFVLFGYLTGWRRNETASLAWADIEGDTICLRDENAKNGEARSVPIEGELAEVVERRRQARLVNGVLTTRVFHRGGLPIGEFRKSW